MSLAQHNSGFAANTWPPRYELLDGLRGLAALAVVLHHLRVFDGGHFAVMIFFVISGYCITASAESYRRNGLGFKQFMLRRIRRIYPPYWLALLFFAVTRVIKASLGAPNDLRRPVLDWVQNLTLTQWLSNLVHPISWPADNPHLLVPAFWSLNYEEQFYLVMALALLLAVTRRIPMVAGVLLLALIGLAWNWSVPGNWICGFFIEFWVHFALGACLYYALCVVADRRVRWAFAGIVLLLGIACAIRLVPWSAGTISDLRSMVELSLLSAFTLCLLVLRPLSQRISRSWVWRPIAALGTISYSLYLIHQFNLNLVATVTLHLLPVDAPYFAQIAVKVALHLCLAGVFWQFCERPFLNKRAVPDNSQALGGASRVVPTTRARPHLPRTM
jgi:peptidoglycan/LPS O-acetylase OafA/YrhL